MENRTKMALCLAGALLCIGAAGVLVHSFSGRWGEEEPTVVAGPALSLNTRNYEPSASTPERYAYITGAVQNPGVYPVAEDARVFHLVEAAGGLRYDADSSQLNLAAPLRDGAHIHVKTVDLTPSEPTERRSSASRSGKKSNKASHAEKSSGTEKTDFVNVNTATEEELCTLPEIGPVLAKRIVDYRTKHGPFENSDALLKVSGIGRSKLQKMRFLLRF